MWSADFMGNVLAKNIRRQRRPMGLMKAASIKPYSKHAGIEHQNNQPEEAKKL